MPDEDSDSDVTLVGETIKSRETTIQPKCWKTMFYLLDLYETKPQTKTVIERISSLMQSGVQQFQKLKYKQMKENIKAREGMSH